MVQNICWSARGPVTQQHHQAPGKQQELQLCWFVYNLYAANKVSHNHSIQAIRRLLQLLRQLYTQSKDDEVITAPQSWARPIVSIFF